MVRSVSCFKIITCSGEDVDRDDFEAPERKVSSDRRGWSFRKRSARHRVLNNTVASEAPSYGNKESPESATIQTPVDSTVPEKISVLQWPEAKPQLSASVDSKETEVACATESKCQAAANLDESIVIAIQTAIRGILARAALIKLKNLVKLQAAVRGHLVRRHAVSTLCCIQAIVKMQALVRDCRTRMSLVRAYTDEKLVEDYGKQPRPLGRDNSINKVRSASIEKLLSNGFARQLLESTPKTKPIHIKCDLSKPNSAWKWLERWTSVSSSMLGQPEKQGADFEQELPKSEHCTVLVVPEESADIKPCSTESGIPSASEESLITYDAEKFEFQAGHPTSTSVSDNAEELWPENTCNSNVKEPSVERVLLVHGSTESNGSSQTGLNFLSARPAVESEQSKRSMKRLVSEQLENGGKKFVSGSRKLSSPAFYAAQSKFKDLSSTVKIGRSIRVAEVETNLEAGLPAADAINRKRKPSLVENSGPQNSRVQVGGSESGTELSVTSTLDSPEISESGALEYDHEAKISAESVCDHNSLDNLGIGSQELPTNTESDSSNLLTVLPVKNDDVKVDFANSAAAVDTVQVGQWPERSTSNLQVESGFESGHQMYRSSPDGSPRSHITIPESQGTPASQVSVNVKRREAKKSGSNNKSRSFPTGKNSPSNPCHDSGARSSAEQLPKDQKIGKRRSSFGSSNTDNVVDQEPRDSSSSNSLPSYMQPTESARAKANLTNSPRSSPDVQDKDNYIKKRHSLPGANGRQGSPHIQRSMSQAQQGTKGNGSHSPHERKWQR